MISHLISGDTVTVFVNNKLYAASKGTEKYETCMQYLRDGAPEEAFEDLFDIHKIVSSFSNGELVITGAEIRYKGEKVHSVVADKLLELVRSGNPYTPLANFLVRLMRNPSGRSVETFYSFMTNVGLPITDDGMVVGWKAVNADYTDKHTGTLDNSVGTVRSCERNKVDDDPNETCSRGYHCGSLRYAAEIFGSPRAGDHIMSVLIDPEHVVCVPYDHDFQKVRVCWYKVIGEVENPLELLENIDSVKPRYGEEYGPVH